MNGRLARYRNGTGWFKAEFSRCCPGQAYNVDMAR
jgi:hypothetical protein